MENNENIQETKRQFCAFWLSDRLFGVDILDVKEINEELSFTNVYHAAQEIKGLVNIRGQIHLIIDLARLIGIKVSMPQENRSLIIFKSGVAEDLGILVDKIEGIVNVDKEAFEPAGASTDASTLMPGVCKLDNKLMDIIDPRCFMRSNMHELAESLKSK